MFKSDAFCDIDIVRKELWLEHLTKEMISALSPVLKGIIFVVTPPRIY